MQGVEHRVGDVPVEIMSFEVQGIGVGEKTREFHRNGATGGAVRPIWMTEQRKAELRALAECPDSEIDYSDIPPLDEEFWQNAVPNPFYRSTKTAKTLRIDSDVLARFIRTGKGYQSRINAVLRDAMLRSMRG